MSVKLWETTHKTRAFPGVGSIVFKSDRSGYLYYDASFRPKNELKGYGTDLTFNMSIPAADLKEALKTVVWDSRGDPCEASGISVDPVCRNAQSR